MKPTDITIKRDDLSGKEIAVLLQQHMDHMHELSPLESIHALDLNALKKPDITFWSAWINEGINGELTEGKTEDQTKTLAGCGALKVLNEFHGEIKSMRTAEQFRGKGIGSAMLKHILQEAKKRGYHTLSLETGSMAGFLPAVKMYEKYGFVECGPFADYKLDVNSIFMIKDLRK